MIIRNYNIDLFSDIQEIFNNILLDSLYDYKLLHNNIVDLKDKDTKKLFSHHFIQFICNNYIENKSILVFDKILQNELFDYFFYFKEITKNINIIKKYLPIPIFFEKTRLDKINFKNKYFWDEGEGSEILLNFEMEMDRIKSGVYNFRKIKNYTKKYKLQFLSEQYFNEINAKNILICNK